VPAGLELGVSRHRFDQRVAVEDVVAHRGQHLGRRVGQTLGRGRLLQELPDLGGVGRVDVDHPELVGQCDRLADRRDRRGCA
jgi:hypothetical protein